MRKFDNLREALEDYLATDDPVPQVIMAERIAFLVGAVTALGLRRRGISVSKEALSLLQEVKNDPLLDIYREGGNA